MAATSRHSTPSAENEDELSTPKPKSTRSIDSRESLSNITNSQPPKRSLLKSSLTPRVSSDRPNASLGGNTRLSIVSATSETPARAHKLSRAAQLANAATPQPTRKRTDTEPAIITPRVKSSADKLADVRKMHSVNDLARIAASSSSLDDRLVAADIEPIRAYLRIRPPPADANKQSVQPYIQVINEKEVLMHPPTQTAYHSSRPGVRSRTLSTAPPTKYIFSRVFGGEEGPQSRAEQASQSSFFQQTTLPLVQDLLQGQSGLMFTYGVTNSGKSYTVMGDDKPGGAGILPRALDVIFNSIQGLESTSEIQPYGVSGIQRVDKKSELTASSSTVGLNPFMIPGLSKRLLNDAISRSLKTSKHREHDHTKLTVDRNLRYSVFVSYVEIYNEKLFDLLDASPGSTIGRSESVRGSNWSLATMANAGSDSLPASCSITINRRPLALTNDIENGGKYVSGLREIKIKSAEEARDLLNRGQENRAVFGTMANRASSRSHGVFTIKIVREHAGAKSGDEDLSSVFSTARLSIVDLAGSERVSNTGLSGGDRLKEAGNINKSLMCLGQCLETLRKNQIRLIAPAEGGQAQIVKRRMSIVPFRHSKLTELFQSFFTGEGKAVMIVNANPYDTGFDENSHVMKFSAIAKEVATTRSQGISMKSLPAIPQGVVAHKGPSMLQEGVRSANSSIVVEGDQEADITIIEDDEESQDEESDPFVDMLVEKHEELRQKLYAAEMRCASIEAQVREEMANEMEQRLLEMQELYNQRMMSDAEQNEDFMNRKIDLFVRTNAGSGFDSEEDDPSDSEEEAEVDKSLAPVDHSEISRSTMDGESVFDDATEGEITEDDEAVLKPGRRTVKPVETERQRTTIINSVNEADESTEHDDSADDEDEDEEESNEDADEDEDDDDENDSDEADDDEVDEVDGNVVILQGDASTSIDDSLGSALSSEADAADSSFDISSAAEAQAESEDEEPQTRRKSGRRNTIPRASQGRQSTSTARGRRASKPRVSSVETSVIQEAPLLTDISDVSMIAEEAVSSKKKRKLRKKAANQEEDIVQQIGDSSLDEAVFHSNGQNVSRSFGSRRSMR